MVMDYAYKVWKISNAKWNCVLRWKGSVGDMAVAYFKALSRHSYEEAGRNRQGPVRITNQYSGGAQAQFSSVTPALRNTYNYSSVYGQRIMG